MNPNLTINNQPTTYMIKPSTHRITLLLLAAAVLALFSSSCRNTVRGAGRDIERAGDHIQNATH
jgi:predicted small secreted protein